jgi:hypothetical protein
MGGSVGSASLELDIAKNIVASDPNEIEFFYVLLVGFGRACAPVLCAPVLCAPVLCAHPSFWAH